MNILFGTNKWNDNKIIWNSEKVVNGHMMIIGGSGSGKTYNIRKIVKKLSENKNNTIHILDVHGDISPDESITSSIDFSEISEYGLNPLKISQDVESGGVRKKIRNFISTINRTSRKLGSKQEAVIMNLLKDIYHFNGFYENDLKTWSLDYDPRKFKKFKKKYPTITDLRKFCEYKYKQMIIGSNSKAMSALEKLNKKVSSLQKASQKSLNDSDIDLSKLKEQVKESYCLYVDSIETGLEIDELIKYDSKEVIKSVYEKLLALESSGIFKNKYPEFDDNKPVKRYNIKALEKDEQQMFVDVLLEEIFREAKQEGLKDGPNKYIIIDEAHMFISDEDTHIINIIAKEARKFGVALILASQSFTHFSDDIIQSTATKVILGIDEMFQKGSAAKLRIDVDKFNYIIPHKTCMMQIKNKGQKNTSFLTVVF